jgi:DNA polymerase-3 subunit alpha
MGKKKPEIMARYRDQFIHGALEKDVDKKIAEEIWELIVYFAGYGFNKSHSAAYALIAYQTAYLKANFGTEFMAALMTTHMGNTDKIRIYLEECSQTDLEVSGPDVNRCRPHFSTDGEKKIRYGLGAIKGVGIRAADTIRQARKHRKDSFEDLFDFCESIDLTLVNKKVLESLAKAGAFDCLDIPRSTAYATIEKALRMGQRSQVDRARGQQSLFGEAPKPQATKEPETQVTAWTPRDQLTYEKEALGFYFSGHPLETDRNTLETFSTHSTRSLRDLNQKREVLVGGMVAEVIPTVVRKGRNAGAKMARILLEDLEGTCRVVIFHDLYKQHMEQLIPDEKLFVRGEFDEMATEPTILARALLPFEAAHATLTERVTVNLPGAHTDQHLTALHKLIERHRGETPLFLKIPTRMGTVLIKTSDAFTIGPSPEFTREAHDLVGEGCVRYSS